MSMLGAEKPFQVDGMLAALRERNHVSDYNSLMWEYNQLLANYNALVERYNKLDELKNLYDTSRMARNAQFCLIADEVPNAPSLNPSGKAFADGKPKTVAQLLFEDTLRTEARKLGVSETVIAKQLAG